MEVVKATLSTGKVVIMRFPLIDDTEKAAQIAGKQADPSNQMHMGILLQKELIKRLLVSVDGKALGMKEKEAFNTLFTVKEYNEVQKVAKKILGDEETGNDLVMEFETSGDK